MKLQVFLVATAVTVGALIAVPFGRIAEVISGDKASGPSSNQAEPATQLSDRNRSFSDSQSAQPLETVGAVPQTRRKPEPNHRAIAVTTDDVYLDPDGPPNYASTGEIVNIGTPLEPDAPETDLAVLMRERTDIGPPLDP